MKGWLVPLCAKYGTTRTVTRPKRNTILTPFFGVTGNSPKVISRSFVSSKKFEELINVPPSGDGFTVDAGLIGSLVGVSVLGPVCASSHRGRFTEPTPSASLPSMAVRKAH